MSELQPAPSDAAAPPTGPAPTTAFPEKHYQDAMAALRNPKRSASGLILVISLAVFVLVQMDQSLRAIVVLVGVLFFHELGHYAGMRLFGYSDVRMFFIPFFGAAVSGKQRSAAPWKEGVVLLLGPLPGIVAAFVIARHIRHEAPEAVAAWREVAISLVSINAFNLLPLAGLDGARLWQHVLFSRSRSLEIAFALLAALGMAWFALESHSIALGVFTYLMLIVLPYRWRLLGAARRLRDAARTLPFDARELDDESGRVVFTAASALTTRAAPKSVAAAMEQLVDAVNARPPSFGASATLGFTWVLGLVFALMTLGLVAGPPPPPGGTATGEPRVAPAPAPGSRLRLGGDGDFELKLRAPGP